MKTNLSVELIHNIWQPASRAGNPTDAVFKDDEADFPLGQDGMHHIRRLPGVHLVQLSSSLPQSRILKVWMVGDRAVSTQLYSGHQLHTACERGLGSSAVAYPLHQLDRVRVPKLAQIGQLFRRAFVHLGVKVGTIE